MVVSLSNMFLFIAEYILCMYYILFIHSPCDRHLGCSHLWAFMNNALRNIFNGCFDTSLNRILFRLNILGKALVHPSALLILKSSISGSPYLLDSAVHVRWKERLALSVRLQNPYFW